VEEAENGELALRKVKPIVGLFDHSVPVHIYIIHLRLLPLLGLLHIWPGII
jgi:hypothetical protein